MNRLLGALVAVIAIVGMKFYNKASAHDDVQSRLVELCEGDASCQGAVKAHYDACFDSAYIYASGACERILGQWIKNRGVREQIVLLDKGAHTPHCNPEAMRSQLAESLARLQTDYVDIYMLHRDNPSIPAGDFIEAPTAGNGAACRSCAHCPWMAMNTLERVLTGLREGSGEIHVDPALIPKAIKPLKRMLDFTQAARMKVAGNA